MKRVSQLAVLLVICVVLVNSTATAQASLSIDIKTGSGYEEIDGTLQLLILLTVLSVAPALLLMTTTFTRFVVVFGMLRHALGLQSSPPNQVIVGLALFMTLFAMSGPLNAMYEQAYLPYRNEEITSTEAIQVAGEIMREHLERNVSEESLALFYKLNPDLERPRNISDVGMGILLPAYILTELTIAFKVGFLVFIPFLIIDMLVATVLMGMGMFMLPPVMISLPFKILLFVLIDGWNLLSYTLLRGVS